MLHSQVLYNSIASLHALWTCGGGTRAVQGFPVEKTIAGYAVGTPMELPRLDYNAYSRTSVTTKGRSVFGILNNGQHAKFV